MGSSERRLYSEGIGSVERDNPEEAHIWRSETLSLSVQDTPFVGRFKDKAGNIVFWENHFFVI